jgi:broad specificity phosphatase PhoE
MLEIIVIRHGETAWNTADIFRGRVQVELSESGLQQAEKLAGYLGRKKIKAVYCSPLQRAFQTAEAVARRQQVTAQPVEDLTDLDFGQWEGVSVQEVKTKYAEIYRLWLERPDLAQVPGGETLQEASKRSLKALDKIIADNKEGVVAVITHRVITKVLECALLGLDVSHFWNIDQDTCGVTNFIYTGKIFILKHHNDISFLNNGTQ